MLRQPRPRLRRPPSRRTGANRWISAGGPRRKDALGRRPRGRPRPRPARCPRGRGPAGQSHRGAGVRFSRPPRPRSRPGRRSPGHLVPGGGTRPGPPARRSGSGRFHLPPARRGTSAPAPSPMAPLISDLASSPVPAAPAAAISPQAAISRSAATASPRPAAAAFEQQHAGQPQPNMQEEQRPGRGQDLLRLPPFGQDRHHGRRPPARPPARPPPNTVRLPRPGGRAGWPAARTGPGRSAACSGGFAAATTATSSGGVEVADGPLDAGRSGPPWTSRRGMERLRRGTAAPRPRPAAAPTAARSRTFIPDHDGPARRSREGSRIEAITVSTGRPIPPRHRAVGGCLAGARHSPDSAGRPAATATPSASTAGFCALISPSVAHRGYRQAVAGVRAQRTGSVSGARSASACASGQPARSTATTR